MSKSDSLSLHSPSPQLQLKQVNLVIEGKGAIKAMPILTDISLAVNRGDRIGLIGPSGAGKTSLLRLLNRLESVTSGTIYLDNQNYQKIPILELRRQVMLVLQEPKLFGMTVREALAYPLVLQKLAKNAMPKASEAINSRIETYRELLHIPNEWLEKSELQLSVGQRQLVAICRALVVEPKVLLLDEPTSALDAGTASHLLKVLVNLAENNQMTILMVNHQLDMAESFCSRILYLQSGRLIHDSPASQIDWQDLREQLIEAETLANQEWS